MNNPASIANSKAFAAIACGGTGGHLFPGLAVGRALRQRGCNVTLFVSSKQIDGQADQAAEGMEVVKLPAIGFSVRKSALFLWRFWQSYRLSINHFNQCPPRFVLAMGGFTAAPPILAGRRRGALTFLHESNSIPGRANRWLARRVDGAFIYFPDTVRRLPAARVEITGMPVREEFLHPLSTAAARTALGLDEHKPVLLVMGGSQGARQINQLMIGALPPLLQAAPTLQFIHLTGRDDIEKVRAAYQAHDCPARTYDFLADMAPVLAAADLAVSRAGASSLAEFAACRVPALLIPYPHAADNHQLHNALAFEQSGAARALPLHGISSESLAREILALLADEAKRGVMRQALGAWRGEAAANIIAERMLQWTACPVDGQAATASDPIQQKPGVLHV